MSNSLNDILKLSVEEKINAVEKIWNSIDDNSFSATEEEITIARERYNECLKNPGELIP